MEQAKEAGVKNFDRFNNAGYKGLYNMYNFQLAKKRDVPRKDLLEYMGRTELAVKSLQTALTEEKIKNGKITGQESLENAHREVGGKVRNLVWETAGVYSEDLPVEKKLPEIKKEFKKARREVKKEYKPQKLKRKKRGN